MTEHLNIFARFGLRLLGPGPHATHPTGWREISQQSISELSDSSQMLLGHCLDRNSRKFSLLDGDTDAAEMLERGWLSAGTDPCVGVTGYTFNKHAWRDLTNVESGHASTGARNRLEVYRRNKTMAYPWVW